MKSTLRDVSTDPVLSNVAIDYKNPTYISEMILPVMTTQKQTGKYYVYSKDKFRTEFIKRAAGAPAVEVEPVNYSTSTYFCEDYAMKDIVPMEIEDQADAPIDAQKDTTEGLMEKLMIGKEYALSTYMASTSNITQNTTLSGTSQWSDYENSDPFTDIQTAKATVHASIFIDPNTLVMGKQVYNKLQQHPDIIDRIKYSQLGASTKDLMARLFDVEQLLVGAAGYNSAIEGQTDSMAYIWGKHAWLVYVNRGSNLKAVTFGWTIKYKQQEVEKWWDRDRKGTYIRVHEYYDQVYAVPTAAYLIKNAVA